MALMNGLVHLIVTLALTMTKALLTFLCTRMQTWLEGIIIIIEIIVELVTLILIDTMRNFKSPIARESLILHNSIYKSDSNSFCNHLKLHELIGSCGFY